MKELIKFYCPICRNYEKRKVNLPSLDDFKIGSTYAVKMECKETEENIYSLFKRPNELERGIPACTITEDNL